MTHLNGFGRGRSWPNLRYYPGICVEDKDEKNEVVTALN
jgi:hypothetical protein